MAYAYLYTSILGRERKLDSAPLAGSKKEHPLVKSLTKNDFNCFAQNYSLSS